MLANSGGKEDYIKQINRLKLNKAVHIFDQYVSNDEIPLYFAAADLVVQPYKSVTGSGVCQLAYGLNKPVIATRLGALEEVVEDGINGKLVPPEDPKALAAAVIESLKPENLACLNNGAISTKKKFSWQRFCNIVIKV